MVERMNLNFQPELVDREEEFSELKERFKKALEGEGSTVFVAGEAGIGKTRLVSELLGFAQDEGAEIISYRCLRDSLQPLMPIKEGLREAGLSHLVSHRPPPKVLSTYLIDDAGILVVKAERGDTDLDSDIFSSMLASVQNFVKDSLSMMGREEKGELNTIGYGDYNILIQSMEGVSLATVIEGGKSELLIDDMREKLSEKVERAKEWDGDTSTVSDIKNGLEWFIGSGKYDGEYLVDEPELKKENLFENVLLGLQRLSRDMTVLIFLDDLQWAGPSTLSLLHYLARNTTEEKVLILGTYRPEDLAESKDGEPHQLIPPKREMKREGLLREIELERLAEKDVEYFIQEVLGECDFERNFLERIHSESEGNPLFLLELTKMLVEEGHIQEKDGLWKLIEPLDEVHIPERVYEMVKKRLEILIKEQRDLLEYASVIGEEFEGKIIAEASAQDRVKVLKNLNDIEQTHGLVRSLGEKYKFDHSKIRDVLYNGMNESLREVYHQVVAESYETLYEDRVEQVIEDLAHHYYKAEDERAGEYLLRAARRAEERYANEEAERFYEYSIQMLKGEEELEEAYEGLGDIHKVMGKYDASLDEYEKALNIATEGEKEALLQEKIADIYEREGAYDKGLERCEEGLEKVKKLSDVRIHLLNSKGHLLFRKGRYIEAEKVLLEAMDIAESIKKSNKTSSRFESYLEGPQNNELTAKTLHQLGTLYGKEGKYDKALDHLERALLIWKALDEKRELSATLNNIGLVYWKKGRFDKALENYQETLEIMRKMGDKEGIGRSLNNIGLAHSGKGDLDKALEYHQKSLEIKKKIGDKGGIARSLTNIGHIYVYKRRWRKAEKMLNKSLDICDEIGSEPLAIDNYCRLGETYVGKENYEAAFEQAEKAVKLSKKMGWKEAEGRAYRILSKVYREKGDFIEAKKKLEISRSQLQEIGAEREEAKSLYEYTILLKMKGERREAREYLVKALELFDKMGMELWAKKCEDALDDL